MKKVLIGIGVVIVILFIIGMTSGNKKSDDSVVTKPEEVKVAQAIEASELVNAFDENAVAAEQNWKGKFVQFNAEVTNITESGLSFQDIEGNKKFSLSQVSCNIKDKSQLLTLKNGQNVTVRGTVGGQFIGVISLNDCEVVQ